MAAIYWECRRGTRPTADGSRLVFMLDRLSDVISDGAIETRLGELEARLATQGRE